MERRQESYMRREEALQRQVAQLEATNRQLQADASKTEGVAGIPLIEKNIKYAAHSPWQNEMISYSCGCMCKCEALVQV
jgi:hypothetical protein